MNNMGLKLTEEDEKEMLEGCSFNGYGECDWESYLKVMKLKT